jgi:hypothetical protein
MLNMNKILIILSFVLLASCSPSADVTTRDIVSREGVNYERDSQTPFSGSAGRDNWLGGFSKDIYSYGKKISSETYSVNDNLVVKTSWKDGKMDGLQEHHYDSGKLKSRRRWEGGKLHGLSESYYEGERISQTCYKNGEEVQMSLGRLCYAILSE